MKWNENLNQAGNISLSEVMKGVRIRALSTWVSQIVLAMIFIRIRKKLMPERIAVMIIDMMLAATGTRKLFGRMIK